MLKTLQFRRFFVVVVSQYISTVGIVNLEFHYERWLTSSRDIVPMAICPCVGCWECGASECHKEGTACRVDTSTGLPRAVGSSPL